MYSKKLTETYIKEYEELTGTKFLCRVPALQLPLSTTRGFKASKLQTTLDDLIDKRRGYRLIIPDKFDLCFVVWTTNRSILKAASKSKEEEMCHRWINAQLFNWITLNHIQLSCRDKQGGRGDGVVMLSIREVEGKIQLNGANKRRIVATRFY